MEQKKFMVMDEKSVGHEAILLAVINFENNEYAIYSIENNNLSSNIYISLIEKDEQGNDILKSIDNNNKKEELKLIIKKMLNV